MNYNMDSTFAKYYCNLDPGISSFQPTTIDYSSLVNLAYPSRQMAHKTHKSLWNPRDE